jgi:hypothetical protein
VYMNSHMRASLDRYITGDYGERQFRGEPEEIEDDGLQTLESAMKYLKPRADADEDEQLIGDYEAYSILQIAGDSIVRDYDCRFCGHYTGRRNSYCSANCAKADAEGL